MQKTKELRGLNALLCAGFRDDRKSEIPAREKVVRSGGADGTIHNECRFRMRLILLLLACGLAGWPDSAQDALARAYEALRVRNYDTAIEGFFRPSRPPRRRPPSARTWHTPI